MPETHTPLNDPDLDYHTRHRSTPSGNCRAGWLLPTLRGVLPAPPATRTSVLRYRRFHSQMCIVGGQPWRMRRRGCAHWCAARSPFRHGRGKYSGAKPQRRKLIRSQSARRPAIAVSLVLVNRHLILIKLRYSEWSNTPWARRRDFPTVEPKIMHARGSRSKCRSG
jgi:hypothetical protein